MPVLQVPLSTSGAILDVEVRASAVLGPRGSGSASIFEALIDTGATITAISPEVVTAVQPQQIGVMPITRPNGTIAWVNSYDVRIQFGSQGRFHDVEAVETQPATPNIDVLIGLDLLLRIRMGWDGRGRLLTLVVR